jgi:hypothetical protein
VRFLSLKSLLESTLQCSLAEQISAQPIPLTFPAGIFEALSQLGSLGSPAAPCSLNAAFLQDGSRILITWRQEHRPLGPEDKGCALGTATRREEVVKFVIQRGLTKLSLPLDQPLSSAHSDSILTASVPVSEDRFGTMDGGAGAGLGKEETDFSRGFIDFETIGEVSVEAAPMTRVVCDESLDCQTRQPRHEMSPFSVDLTLGTPPLASIVEMDSGSCEEKGDRGPSEQAAASAPMLRHHSDHSFEFDSFDSPHKLIHFRVKAIDRDGLFPSPSLVTLTLRLLPSQVCRATGPPPPVCSPLTRTAKSSSTPRTCLSPSTRRVCCSIWALSRPTNTARPFPLAHSVGRAVVDT